MPDLTPSVHQKLLSATLEKSTQESKVRPFVLNGWKSFPTRNNYCLDACSQSGTGKVIPGNSSSFEYREMMVGFQNTSFLNCYSIFFTIPLLGFLLWGNVWLHEWELWKTWVIFASTTATKFAADFSLLFKTNLRVVMQVLWAHAQWGKKSTSICCSFSWKGTFLMHVFVFSFSLPKAKEALSQDLWNFCNLTTQKEPEKLSESSTAGAEK